MEIYKKYESDEKANNDDMIENIHIGLTMDDYLHLLHCHDTDEEFEYIFNKLPDCDISKCNGYRRNYRDRSKDNEYTFN